MVKKKIDNRIRVMIENGVKLNHRSMFIIIGDKARDQVCFDDFVVVFAGIFIIFSILGPNSV